MSQYQDKAAMDTPIDEKGPAFDPLGVSAVDAESEYTEEQNKLLLRKIDWMLMPSDGIQYADKQSISNSTLFGIAKDTNLHGEFPMNYVMQKVRLGRFLSIAVFVWGGFVMLIAVCHNWTGLMILRTLIGGFDVVFTGVITYGIGSATQRAGSIAAWRAINLFLGGMTSAWAIVLFLFIGTPDEVRWLTPEQKKQAAARIVSNQSSGGGQSEWKRYQVLECLRDPQVYAYFLIAFLADVPNGGYGIFGGIVTKVILLNMPGGAIGGSFNVLSGYISSRISNTRTYFMAFSMVAGTAGLLMAALLPQKHSWRWTKWGGLLMMSIYSTAVFMSWSMIPSNVAEVGSLDGIIRWVLRGQHGRLTIGLIASAVCFGLTFFVILALRFYYMWANAKRDEAAAVTGLTKEEMLQAGKVNGENDMTDMENPHFRYTY
ncbi:hypothetical protein IAU60_006909 [Kwoniella sp. DSM 27419]